MQRTSHSCPEDLLGGGRVLTDWRTYRKPWLRYSFFRTNITLHMVMRAYCAGVHGRRCFFVCIVQLWSTPSQHESSTINALERTPLPAKKKTRELPGTFTCVQILAPLRFFPISLETVGASSNRQKVFGAPHKLIYRLIQVYHSRAAPLPRFSWRKHTTWWADWC